MLSFLFCRRNRKTIGEPMAIGCRPTCDLEYLQLWYPSCRHGPTTIETPGFCSLLVCDLIRDSVFVVFVQWVSRLPGGSVYWSSVPSVLRRDHGLELVSLGISCNIPCCFFCLARHSRTIVSFNWSIPHNSGNGNARRLWQR